MNDLDKAREWVDAEKLREALEGCDKMTYPYEVIEHIEKTLLTPKLPTLAELIEQGNDPEGYQRMQCEVEYSERKFIIRKIDLDGKVLLLREDLLVVRLGATRITPLPDLPKLEWPGGGVEDALIVDGEPALPRPEDVPAGEAWLIRPHENADPVLALRVHTSKYGSGKRWAHFVTGSSMMRFEDDEDITLVSRLVPEVTA